MTKEVSEQPFARSWSVPIAVTDVPEAGRHFVLVADEGIRTAVAERAGLRALPRLAADFDVTRHGRNGLHVAGRVVATVGQVCVVSLDPVEEDLDEAIDVIFSPSSATGTEEIGGEIEVPPEDGPEPLVDGLADLGALAVEFLILGINPYPRKPDAHFEPPAADDEVVRPFDVLAALKKSPS
jgi:hypothetical protein